MAILDQRLLILGRSKICLNLFIGQNYVPFYYWLKIYPLYLLVKKVSVDNMSVENMSVEKTSRCQNNAFLLHTFGEENILLFAQRHTREWANMNEPKRRCDRFHHLPTNIWRLLLHKRQLVTWPVWPDWAIFKSCWS